MHQKIYNRVKAVFVLLAFAVSGVVLANSEQNQEQIYSTKVHKKIGAVQPISIKEIKGPRDIKRLRSDTEESGRLPGPKK